LTDNGVNTIGYAAQRIMEFAGLSRATIESWGGSCVDRERANECGGLLSEGKVDAVVHEAIMTQWWRDLTETRETAFLPMEETVLAAMERDYQWPRASLPDNCRRSHRFARRYRAFGRLVHVRNARRERAHLPRGEYHLKCGPNLGDWSSEAAADLTAFPV
jgi:hypothetical protein